MRACDLNLCIDLHRSRQIPALPASRSCPATPSTNPLNRVGCPRAPHLQRPNPHRACCTTAAHFPRFPPLEVFVRRPPERVAPPSWAGIRKPSQQETSACLFEPLIGAATAGRADEAYRSVAPAHFPPPGTLRIQHAPRGTQPSSLLRP